MNDKTVRVTCSSPNGLALHLFEAVDDGTGVPAGKTMHRVGAEVAIAGPTPDGAPGITEVDKVFFDKWLEQNAENPLVVGKLIGLEEKREEDRR